MEALLAGNEEAVRTLYARYARSRSSRSASVCSGARRRRELTQDVFVAAWRKAPRFDPSRGRLSTWLMTIAHNLAVDRLAERPAPPAPSSCSSTRCPR